MPGWEETENEIRYRLRAPEAFTPGSFRFFAMQNSPEVDAVIGRLRGEENTTIQALRFPRKRWSLLLAQRWLEERKEKLMKRTIVDFLEKGNLTIHALSFSQGKFSEDAVKDWLTNKGLDVAGLQKAGDTFAVSVRGSEQFKKGSLRDIVLRDGLVATVGILTRELQKSMQKRVPERFALMADALHELFEIDITEVTLTSSPAVGKMAEFLVVKSAKAQEETYSETVPIIKVDSERKQVGAYVLVPDLPDWQGDIISKKEVELAAHRFLKNMSERAHQGSGTGLEHKAFDGIGYPVESFIDDDGQHGVKGGWFVKTQVTSDDVWNGVKKGEIIGYSVGGSGSRRKAQINIDAPVAKAKQGDTDEELAPNTPAPPPPAPQPKESDASLITRLLAWLKGQVPEQPPAPPQPAPEVAKTGEQTQKEEDEVKLELLKKLNVAPSVVEELEGEGVDIEKAYDAVTALLKALNINLSMAGLGYTTIQLTTALRNGDFGKWPNTDIGGGENMAKNQQTQTPAPPQQPPEEVVKMQAENEELKKALATIMERLDQVENARGVRKSSTLVEYPDPNAQQEPEDDGWEAMDSIDMPLHKAIEVAKSMGANV